MSVQVPRVRDRGANEDGGKIKYRSALVPPYLRKAKSVEELLPCPLFACIDMAPPTLGHALAKMNHET